MDRPKYAGMSGKDYQLYLNEHHHPNPYLKIDGVEGDKTQLATMSFLVSEGYKGIAGSRNYTRQRLAVNQIMLTQIGMYHATIDGLYGPDTEYAIELWQNSLRDDTPFVNVLPSKPTAWPTYGKLTDFYGEPGTGHVQLTLPYPLRIAWDTSQFVNRIEIHGKCADSFKRILNKTLTIYGYEQIGELKLDLWGGCYNNRLMRGSRTKKSVHAWAAASDFAPLENPLRAGADKALFSRPAYDEWWKAVDAEGWVSLGRERNYDWMHIQACQL